MGSTSDLDNNFRKTIGSAIALFSKERKGIAQKKEIKEGLLKLFKLSLEIYEIRISYFSQLKRNYIVFLNYLIESKEIKEWEKLKLERKKVFIKYENEEQLEKKIINEIELGKKFIDKFPEDRKTYYEEKLKVNEEEYYKYLSGKSLHKELKEGYYLLVLRKWNSYTPALSFSEGGGYFFFKINSCGKIKLGIAIDPGYAFIKNLFHYGFAIPDIDVILLTHDHGDHISEFEDLITLFYQIGKRFTKKKIYAAMTQGCLRNLESIIKDNRNIFHDTIIMESGDKIVLENYANIQENINCKESENNVLNETIEIKATKAFHRDLSATDCIGFSFEIKDNEGNKKLKWGYTGDTMWGAFPTDVKDVKSDFEKEFDLTKEYEGCDLLCAHLGSVIKPKDNQKLDDLGKPKDLLKILEKENHLCLVGILSLFEATNPTLGIISEFGEEMKGGLRIDLIEQLNNWKKKKKTKFLPADVGLLVHLDSKSDDNSHPQILCIGCNQFIKPDWVKTKESDDSNSKVLNFKFVTHSEKENTYYICKHCHDILGPYLLEDKIKKLEAKGFPLEILKDKNENNGKSLDVKFEASNDCLKSCNSSFKGPG